MFRKKLLLFLWLIVPPCLSLNNLITKDNVYRSYEFHDILGRRDKQKIIHLSHDLIIVAYQKMRQIIEIREEHELFTPFNIGVIIGKIGEKFRYMIDIYKDIIHKDEKRTELIGPGIRTLRVLHYILAMEQVHFLELEIDEFIHVLEREGHKDMVENKRISSVTKPEPQWLRNGRGTETEDEEDSEKEAEEQKVKSKFRELFLMKRLGSNITTTKKRFIDRWPVEDTWSMEGTNIY